MQTRIHLRPLVGGALLLLALAGCQQKADVSPTSDPNATATATAAPTGTLVAGLGAAGIAGLNWADPRDNFVDDALVLSGLASGDSYATVQSKADYILGGFLYRTGANTVRLPINPTTATGSTWTAYQGAIDKALSKNMKVILCCWEGNSSRDGRVDNLTQFNTMWQTVVTKYGGSSGVYFEVFNEPHGYSLSELSTLYANWLTSFPNVPRNRVLLDGEGYAQNIINIGADARFSSCLLSIHLYDFFYSSPTTTAASWESAFAKNLGSYGSRAVLTEWGAFMTTGVNYNEAINNDVKKSYVLGISNYCRQNGIASVYWPGLRTGDQYSLLQFDNNNTTISNTSGLGRVLFGWGSATGGTEAFYTGANYRLLNRNSGLAVDVNQASTADAAPIIQWYQNGANNQQWQLATASGYTTLTNRNSGKVLDVNGASTTDSAPIIQYPSNGGNNQQWQLAQNTEGYYTLKNRNSGKLLDVNQASTTAGTALIQYQANNGNNQQWLVWQQ
jgi:hypothetical protein